MVTAAFVGSKPVQPHPGDHFAMTFAPLSLDEVYKLADDSANGAIVVMSGMVRDNTDGKAVVCLEYQAYEPMALQVFRQIAAEIRHTWTDVTHVVIHQWVGIDTLKHNAPIWKKEHWEDGSTSWVSIAACEQNDC